MDVLQLPSRDLAYFGDSVVELLVRKRLLVEGHSGAGKLNKLSLAYVTASAQAKAAERILGVLTEVEADVFRRAKNQSKTSVPHSATVAEYRCATGFEALFAYLYLSGNVDRAQELFDIAYPEGTSESAL